MMSNIAMFDKGLKVVKSCETLPQLYNAIKYLNLMNKKYSLDYPYTFAWREEVYEIAYRFDENDDLREELFHRLRFI